MPEKNQRIPVTSTIAHKNKSIGAANRRKAVSVFFGGCAMALCLHGGTAFAQAYPNKPIRLIVPFAPGGVVDITARQVAQKMSESLGQPVLIDNRSGAGGTVGTEFVAKSPADGYTLLMAFDTHAVNPFVYKSLRYDSFKDFEPVSLVGSVPILFATNATFPATSIAEFLKVAKTKPGLSYASVGAGSSGHLAAEQFKQLSGVDMLHIPFKGGAPALNALLGEQVQLIVFAAGAAVPFVKSGKVHALAITGASRSAALPGVPTMKEAGFAQLNAGAWMGILAPAGTPPAIVNRLQMEVAKAAKDKTLSTALSEQAVELIGSSPAAFGRLMKSENEKWGKLIKEANLNLEQ